MALNEAQAWIDQCYAAGAKQIGATCNPIRRLLYVTADDERMTIKCYSQFETRILKDTLHDYIGQLPRRD